MPAPTIQWFTSCEPDAVGLEFIVDTLKANRRTRDAVLQICEPTEIDGEGTIMILHNPLYRLIDPGNVRALIDACMG